MHLLGGQVKNIMEINGTLACHEKFDIHDYDIITINREHCSSRFTGMLLLPVST